MVCIYCSHKTTVTNSRRSKQTKNTWRRRRCTNCNAITTSHEVYDLSSALRVSNSRGGLRPFLRDKLFVSVYEAVSHRKTGLTDASELTDTIICQVLALNTNGLIDPALLRSLALNTLNRFDHAAGTYYQAHHAAATS